MSSDEAFLVELLQALRSAGLEALIVGNVAAVLQGAPVTTQDVDLLVRDTPGNRTKLQKVCDRLQARAVRISPLTASLSLVGAAIPVDVMFDQLSGGLRFEALRARSVEVPIGEMVARVASLDDIITSKEAANRPKDRAHLEVLRQTRRVRDAME